MTLILVTKSHGEVESGFLGSFTQCTRLGEYTFSTKHFCDLIQYLASNSEHKDARITCSTIDTFFEKQNTHFENIVDLLKQTNADSFEEFGEKASEKLDDYFKKENQMQNEATLEDVMMMPVKINKKYTRIKIGKYEIEKEHFKFFANYIARGGFFGYGLNAPDYSRPTLDAIKNSENELFK